MSARPLIGIPARSIVDRYWGLRFGVLATYTRALDRAGGAPLVIPLELSADALESIFERLDGLLLAGGFDIHPTEFGEQVEPFCGEIDAARDAVELRLTRRALNQAKPLLGICRGLQMVNVAAGGSLYQDISRQMPGALEHEHRHGEPFDKRVHPVELEPASRVARALGVTQLKVNSLHHQALKRLAPGLRVVGRAPDGIVEAVEGGTGGFVVAVQFHPEWMMDDDPRMLGLFRALVQAAQEQRPAANLALRSP